MNEPNTHVDLSPELRGWIAHNLGRGCAAGDLVDSMVGQNFEPALARGLVDAFVQARRAGVEPPRGAIEIALPPDAAAVEPPRRAAGPVIHSFDRDIPVLLRLEQPALALLGGVLGANECDELIALARSRLRPSTVIDPASGEDKVAEHRDSEGMFFRLQETPLIARLERRIAEVMNVPLENGEGLQVLRYLPGARSAPHFDFLLPSNDAARASIERSGQRIATMLVYLNDVASGGETLFPEAGGLAVVPVKGNGLCFEYMNRRRQLDPRSVHAGAVVQAGEKWVATKWLRERRFVPSPAP